MSETFRRRRELRQVFEKADQAIDQWDLAARLDHAEKVPPIEAPAENVAASSTAEITVNVLWLAYMLDYAQGRAERPGVGA